MRLGQKHSETTKAKMSKIANLVKAAKEILVTAETILPVRTSDNEWKVILPEILALRQAIAAWNRQVKGSGRQGNRGSIVQQTHQGRRAAV